MTSKVQTQPGLSKNKEMKKLFPHIRVVTRQGKRICNKIMKNKYSSNKNENSKNKNNSPTPPAGNFKLHNNRCKLCERMADNKQEWKSNKTGRSYKISRHYTCATSHCIYLVDCKKCQAQYIGQTRQSMSKRHYRHRQEVKVGIDWFGIGMGSLINENKLT